MSQRKDEQPRTWFRSDRVFCSEGSWYFHTREGLDVGPYRARFEAEVDAEMLKSLLVGLDDKAARGIVREFMLDDRTTLPADVVCSTDYLLEEGLHASPRSSA